ncbi:hypothetical protein CHARACLAT_031948 [Characodon lateralis]|uniref:Uncharacterized protein n=1 Tax=Characodon lateralis TaxID=208331 RepID=A0ABU7DWK0_9TELE|nr:hypothetical protein [Characodon lateralis]
MVKPTTFSCPFTVRCCFGNAQLQFVWLIIRDPVPDKAEDDEYECFQVTVSKPTFNRSFCGQIRVDKEVQALYSGIAPLKVAAGWCSKAGTVLGTPLEPLETIVQRGILFIRLLYNHSLLQICF